jgi:hypothetical protein
MAGVTKTSPGHRSTQKAALPAAMPANPKVTSRGNHIFLNGADEHSGNLGLVLAILLFLLAYVVPQVASVFAGSKRALPLLTQMMLGLSAFVRNYGGVIFTAIVFIAGCARIAWSRASFRQNFDATWLRLPVLGRLARGYNAARFSSTLAMLSAAGVPILKALQAAADTLSNRAMRADGLEALVLVREVAPLASALAHKQCFPALLEPLLIVVMGLVVMLVVLAVLLPSSNSTNWSSRHPRSSATGVDTPTADRRSHQTPPAGAQSARCCAPTGQARHR